MARIKAIKTKDGKRIEVGGKLDGHGVRAITDGQYRMTVYLKKHSDDPAKEVESLKREYTTGSLEYIEYEKCNYEIRVDEHD